SDTLAITMSTTGVTQVAPGATPDAGVVGSPDGATTFSGIEFLNVFGTVGGANILIVNGTNGNDSIALQHFGLDRVFVNDRAPVGFGNSPTVTLPGRFGDDRFSITPVGLSPVVTAINVNGNDPTASDTLIVNGTPGTDMINYAPTAADMGTVTVNAA